MLSPDQMEWVVRATAHNLCHWCDGDVAYMFSVMTTLIIEMNNASLNPPHSAEDLITVISKHIREGAAIGKSQLFERTDDATLKTMQ